MPWFDKALAVFALSLASTLALAIPGGALNLAQAGTVTVFAASSLQKPLSQVVADYGKATGNTVIVSYGASGPMAQMIERGAPADIYISADPKWMDMLEAGSHLATGSRRTLFGNTLVLVAPASSPLALALRPGLDLGAALGTGRLALCNVRICPAGTYGREALVALGAWDRIADRVIEADNVRAALNFVVLGEAPLGIVYGSDATTEPGVKVVGTFPANTHRRVIYEGAVVATSSVAGKADFLAFMAQPAQWHYFEKAGFTPPASSAAGAP